MACSTQRRRRPVRLRRSRDNGETWQLVREFTNDTVNIVYGVARAQILSRELLAPGTEGTQFLVSQRAVMYRSRDEGVTWSKFVYQSLRGSSASINGFLKPAPGASWREIVKLMKPGGILFEI
jgi:BNR/Asp-box repeat